MKVFRIEYSTYEGGNTDYPVVVHQFTGRSEDEARGYLRAHLKTDTFFRGCTLKKRFRNFGCESRVTFRGWVEL